MNTFFSKSSICRRSSDELVRTKTLVKNSIIQIEAAPFITWYKSFYGVPLGKVKDKQKRKQRKRSVSTRFKRHKEGDPKTKSNTVVRRRKKKHEERNKDREIEVNLSTQFKQGRLYACISSRPGQCGRCDGYIIEAKE
jgi:small subunit ribosomal protein S8e